MVWRPHEKNGEDKEWIKVSGEGRGLCVASFSVHLELVPIENAVVWREPGNFAHGRETRESLPRAEWPSVCSARDVEPCRRASVTQRGTFPSQLHVSNPRRSSNRVPLELLLEFASLYSHPFGPWEPQDIPGAKDYLCKPWDMCSKLPAMSNGQNNRLSVDWRCHLEHEKKVISSGASCMIRHGIICTNQTWPWELGEGTKWCIVWSIDYALSDRTPHPWIREWLSTECYHSDCPFQCRRQLCYLRTKSRHPPVLTEENS